MGDDSTNQGDIEHREKDLDAGLKETEELLNNQRKELIEKYDLKMCSLRDELELRMKVEIHEIEERKN